MDDGRITFKCASCNIMHTLGYDSKFCPSCGGKLIYMRWSYKRNRWESVKD